MELKKEKIKVLFFTAALGWGGITRTILNLSKEIDSNQFTPYITVYNDKGARTDELPQGIQFYPLNVQGEGKGKELPRLFLTYRKILGKIDPDVVISSVWKPCIVSLILHRMDFCKKRKLIVREDMAFSPYFRATHGKGLKGRLSPVLTKWLYPHADHIVAVSEGLKKESIRFGIPEEKITVIHNPLDLGTIDLRKREPLETDRPFILSVGRLSREKNIPLLIRAFHLIKERWEGNLLILGTGEEEHRLRHLVQSLRLEERVLFKGYVFNPYSYMHHARVFILSSDSEGFPHVLLEAMACGSPVVSTDCPHGPKEIIRDRVSGFLVPVGDAAKLAEAIERILGDHSLRESFIRNGHQSIQSYDIDATTRRYEKLIVDLYSTPPFRRKLQNRGC